MKKNSFFLNKINIPTIYVGYDPREHTAYDVLKYTALKFSSAPINVFPIDQDVLRKIGLYRRAWLLGSSHKPYQKNKTDAQHVDLFDRRPFSTDFSFTRFLVPFLNRLSGWALYMDCDMYFRSDPIELFNKYKDKSKAIYCVKHLYKPVEKIKMYGAKQIKYSRKNWSSLVLYNCSHPSHNNFTVDDVNTKSGRWLHNFSWLKNSEIGSIQEKWNWLEGYSSQKINPMVVHFTRGGPWFKTLGYHLGKKEKKFFNEWNSHLEQLKKLNLS
jgi:hypothetical protein